MKEIDNNSFGFVTRVLIVFICALLIFNFARSLVSRDMLTFQGLLEMMQNCPSVDVNTLTDLTIYGDWGLFDFVRSFLNVFTGIMSILRFIGVNVVNCILFIGYFVTNIFVPIA